MPLCATTAAVVWYTSRKNLQAVALLLTLVCLCRETGFFLLAEFVAAELLRRSITRALLYGTSVMSALFWHVCARLARVSQPHRPRSIYPASGFLFVPSRHHPSHAVASLRRNAGHAQRIRNGRLVLAHSPETRPAPDRSLLCSIKSCYLRATHVGNHLQHCKAVVSTPTAASATRIRHTGPTLAMAKVHRRNRRTILLKLAPQLLVVLGVNFIYS